MSTLEMKAARRGVKSLAATGLELKFSTEKPGQVTGYGSIFGVKDSYDDIVAPGAFSKSLAEWKAKGRLPAMLWQHHADEPIGKWTEMVEDERGLRCTGELLLSVEKGAEAYEHLKAGNIGGLSIGFRAVSRTWDVDTEIRTLNVVDLWEVSLVTFPACDPARVDGVKGAEEMTIREFEEFLRDEGGFSNTRAREIAERGFKASRAPRDEGGGLDELLASIKGATRVLKTPA